MRIEAILFDLDGTLVDSLADIGAAANRVLERLGQPPHPLSAYLEFVGQGVARLLERALPPSRQDLLSPAVEDFMLDYPQHLLVETRPYAGVEALLEALRERSIPLAVCSNKPQAATEVVVDGLFAEGTFRVVEGHRAERPRKPDPAAPLEIATTLGVDPARVLFVGDTKTDMLTAKAAGMVAVGVGWGFRPRAELEAHGAHTVLERPAELLDLSARP